MTYETRYDSLRLSTQPNEIANITLLGFGREGGCKPAVTDISAIGCKQTRTGSKDEPASKVRRGAVG